METIKKVRLAARRDGKSIKQIARELRLSKNTVRKVLREDVVKLHYEPLRWTRFSWTRICRNLSVEGEPGHEAR